MKDHHQNLFRIAYILRQRCCLLAGAVLVAATGCSKEHGQMPGVRILPQIETRVAALNFESGDCIGLDIVRSSGSFASNEPLTYDGSSFVSASLLWYADGADAATLTAYYPYAAGGRPERFTVEADQSQGITKSDLLGAVKEGVTPTSSAVSMVFKHLLARLVIVLDNQTTDGIGSIELTGLTGTAAIDWTQLVATADGEALTIQPYSTGTNTYTAVLVPQEGTLTVRVTTTGGQQQEQQLSVRLDGRKSYTLGLSLAEEGLQVTVSGDITDWEDGGDPTVGGGSSEQPGDTPGDDQTGSETPAPSETLTIGSEQYALRTIGGKVWMAQNLRTLPSGKAAGSEGAWYPSQNGAEAREQVAALGYLYDYETAAALCPAGWHLPAKAELEALSSADMEAGFFACAGFWRSVSGAGSYDSKSYLMGEQVEADEVAVLAFSESGATEVKELSAANGYSVRFVKD